MTPRLCGIAMRDALAKTRPLVEALATCRRCIAVRTLPDEVVPADFVVVVYTKHELAVLHGRHVRALVVHTVEPCREGRVSLERARTPTASHSGAWSAGQAHKLKCSIHSGLSSRGLIVVRYFALFLGLLPPSCARMRGTSA